MSFPNIPDISPAIDINRDDVINLILASIAFEEFGLSHIINSEAEKIQYILGTLDGQPIIEPPTIDDLLKTNDSVNQTLKSVINNQILLQFKLEDTITTSTTTSTSSTTTTSTTTTTSSTTTTTSSTTTTTSSTTTTTSSTTTTTSSTTTTTTSSTTTTTSSTTTTTSSTTTTTSSTTTTTTTTTTSTTSTTTTTTKTYTDVGSAWSVGTNFGEGNAQYTTLLSNLTEKTVVLGLGQNNIPIGTVQIKRVGNNLEVTITTDSPDVMDEAQLYVNNIAPTNSAPGSFPYKYTVTNPADYFTSHTFTVDVSAFVGETLYISAHAHILQ